MTDETRADFIKKYKGEFATPRDTGNMLGIIADTPLWIRKWFEEEGIRIGREETIRNNVVMSIENYDKMMKEHICLAEQNGMKEVLNNIEKWTQLHPAQYGQIKKGIESLLAGKERDDCTTSKCESLECNVMPKEVTTEDVVSPEISKDEIDKAIPITVERIRREAVADFVKRVEVDYLYKCLGIKNPKMSSGWMKLKKEFGVE